jgi:hypothetical protein
MAQLLRDLEAQRFETRQQATEMLTRLGGPALPALRRVLDGKPPLETRRRVQRIIDDIRQGATAPSAHWLRVLRALEIIERVGGGEARTMLNDLLSNAAEPRVAAEAKTSLIRVARRVQ